MATLKKTSHGTGVMNKLRDKMPYIIIFLIIAFVGLIVFEWGMNYLGMRGGEGTFFAKINGEEITYQEFEQLLQQQVEMMRQQNGGKDIDDATMDQIREQVWNSIVQQTLTKQEIRRLGIKVDDAEILDVIYNRPMELPEAVRRNFMDSTGTFNADFYQQALGMKTKEATQFWNEVEKYMRDVLVAEKLQNYLTASVVVPETDVIEKYKDENIKSSFNFIFMDINGVTDTNVFRTSDDELKQYYNENKDEFKQPKAVRFKYAIFSDAPTIEDSTALKKQFDIYAREMKEGKLDDSTLIKTVNEYSSVPFNDNFQKPSAIGQAGRNALNFLFNAKPGDMSQLIMDQDGYKLIKLLDTKEGEDTYVSASHILINFNNDTVAAKKQADDILAKVIGGQDFNQVAFDFSQDPSAKQNRGDLGWFTKGAMVKEFEDACFNGSVGQIVGPVKTQFGFHIIKIQGKSKKEFRFAEIRKAVTAGQRTKDIARKKAQEFIADIESGMFIDSLAKHLQVMLFSTPEISEDGFVPGAGGNKNLIEFGLDNKKGKVYGPVKVQGGFGVYMVAEKIAEGYKNFDSVKVSMVKPKVQQKKKFAYLMATAAEMKSKLMGTDLFSIQNTYPQFTYATADSMSVSKPDNRIGLEYPVLDAINKLNPGEVSQPIKGLRGVFILKMLWKTPFDQNDYIVKSAELRRQLLTTKKQQFMQEWMAAIQQRAKIIDNRDKFF